MYTLKQENFISISSMLKNHLFKYPSPASLTYWWNLGFILMIFLSLQLISGIFLAMHYCSDTTLAFISVEHIMRDINFGWLFRYAHANGASFFFICVYLHIFRGLFFKSFLFVNFKVWISGVILFLLMMGTAFIGYVLPWGQMSFWGATVITNMASAVPWVGSSVVSWIWGGFSVGAPTLSRFFSFHYVLPFVVLAFALIHMAFLHEKGSSNPALISPKVNRLYIPLYPYFIIKDLFGASVCLVIFFYFISFFPDFLGHSDNYIEADSLSTPPHIVPEWYFLPFYAILRSIDNKISGVLAMLSAIAMYLKLPYYSNLLYRSELTWFVNSFFFRGWFNPICAVWFTHIVFILGWLGAKPVEAPYVGLGEYIVKIYFFFFPIFFLLLPAFLSWVLQSNELNDDTKLSKILLKWHKNSKFDVNHYYPQSYEKPVLFHNLLFYSSVTNYIDNPEIFNANLFTLSIFIFAIIFFILLLLFLSLLFSNSFFLNTNTNFDKPFECGFSPFLINPSVKMSVHAFRIALIFLLFDLEILYLLPWVYSLKHFLLIKSTFFLIGIFPFFFILFIGILYEYSTSLTDWRAFSL